MTKFKRVVALAAAAILATGVFAGASAPASATDDSGAQARMQLLDTGWG